MMNTETVAQEKGPHKAASVLDRATLSRREVAAKLGVHPRTIYRQEQQGAFPRSRCLGRKLLYRVEDIEAYLAGTWNGTGGPA